MQDPCLRIESFAVVNLRIVFPQNFPLLIYKTNDHVFLISHVQNFSSSVDNKVCSHEVIHFTAYFSRARDDKGLPYGHLLGGGGGEKGD